MQHYFLKQSLVVDQIVELPTKIKHHFFGVLRSQPKAKLELVDENHIVFQAIAIDPELGTVKIETQLDRQTDLPVEATIICGLAKQSKPELIVQKATELGVAEVIFIPMERSIVKWGSKSEKKIERLQEVAVSAAEQSHRNSVPNIRYLAKLTELADQNYDRALIAYEEAAKQGEKAQLVQNLEQLSSGESVSCVFGPEGGITDTEVNWLTDHGYQPVGLGPRILRTETAPMYFLSAVSVILELSQM
ncbi:RsmE family RNA methyltransferase [Lentilactobacillus senioris DSM 24302 = JCM 17472]|uniref:Ribosomal RNA small subunit methyltransferase E n=1 Tax=Lentilactobacillus senioris DSM 24302 = JCM 17472 TaxID=1423802 RepID=A0A0R2D030_9LACO|nr:16S rRNA (uracil(1498)-N(3))-methyltransferase [Lentilactobacillus senioris]KRM93769.1 RsmE family RNA methyltransferase [Lentilactobacillus senioris DSM 24302 = JCM 17472]